MGMIWSARRMGAEQAQHLAQQLATEDEAALDAMQPREEAPVDGLVDVDMAWHALETLYAAAGATSPISTGRVPSSDDVAVGCIEPARVKAIVAGMGRISPTLLRRGYDAKRFTREHVYPEIWGEGDVLDTYVMPYDAELRAFFGQAAEADEAIVWNLV